MAGTDIVGVAIISPIILITNAMILITLIKTKTFSRSIKLHLGLFTLFDCLTNISLSLRFILGDSIAMLACKTLLGLGAVAGTAMICMNISMTLECLSVLVPPGSSSSTGCLSLIVPRTSGSAVTNPGCLYANSWQLKRRGVVTMILTMVLSGAMSIGLIVKPPLESADKPFTCMSLSPEVYHDMALKVWAAQIFILVNANIILLMILAYYLNANDNRSKKAMSRHKKVHPVTYKSGFKTSMNNTKPLRPNNITFAIAGPSTSYTPKRNHMMTTDNSQVTFKPNPTSNTQQLRSDAKPQLTNSMSVQPIGMAHPNMASTSFGGDIATTERGAAIVASPEKKKRFSRTANNVTVDLKRKRKSSVGLMMLAASFFAICYVPYIYTLAIYTFCPDHCGIQMNHVRLAATLSVGHGLFNAIIYVSKDKQFRKAMMALFVSKKKETVDKKD